MHNLYTIFSKILKICKQFGDNLINEKGNIPRPGVVPKFSDIEVIALNLTSEAMGIDWKIQPILPPLVQFKLTPFIQSKLIPFVHLKLRPSNR